MELMTLDSSFQPVNLVENFESLIWTERYSAPGDFELVSGDIDGMLKLLPRETYICLRESTVPMIIENHKITKAAKESPKISVTGRSFETVLERRASVKSALGGTVTRSEWMMAADSESSAAFRAIQTVIGDVAQYKNGLQVLPPIAPAVSPLDAIPEISLILPNDYITSAWSATISYSPGEIVGSGTTIYQSTSLISPGNLNKPPATSPTYWTALYTGQSGTWGQPRVISIEASNLYGTVMNLCSTNFRGMKAIRPLPGSSKVGIEIYNGVDRRSTVVFDARFDQIDSATYLLSNQASTNVAYVYGVGGSDRVLKNAIDATHPEPSGLNRRVLLLDVTGETTIVSSDNRQSTGLIELYKNNATALVDGEVSPQVGSGFNHDYFLGDILLLIAEYGLTRNVRVSEFIRTSDDQGEKAYPAFEAVD